MNRDEIVMKILPNMLEGSHGLGSMTEQERKETFALLAKIAYEIADAVVKASVIIPDITE